MLSPSRKIVHGNAPEQEVIKISITASEAGTWENGGWGGGVSVNPEANLTL